MRLVSWNVNGLRSVARKGFLEWLSRESPDVVCLQETKIHPSEVEEVLLNPFDYKSYFFAGKKKGYSGVAVYTRVPPKDVRTGTGTQEFDDEGRVLELDFGTFVLLNCYFPNSQREHARLPYKLAFCDHVLAHCQDLVLNKQRHVVICGDFNVAHNEIDLFYPKANRDNAGFLPEERAWMDRFIAAGFVDTFRQFCSDGGCYTWWSYRPGIRERNIGWRIDYFCVNQGFLNQVVKSEIHSDVMGSDHCPVSLLLK